MSIELPPREQIGLCVDEKYYATLSAKHRVVGKSIEARDMTEGRPSFKKDGLFAGIGTQTALARSELVLLN